MSEEGQGEGRPANEVVVNGRVVRMRRRFPAKENWDLPGLFMRLGGGGDFDLQQMVPILPRLIESWEFAGDPADEAAYGELDLFRELIPLVRGVSEKLQELMGPASGEAGRAST